MDLCNGSRIFFQPTTNWWAKEDKCSPMANSYSLQGRTITVGGLEYPPFFYTNKSGENIKYYGFSVELLLIVSQYLGFRFNYTMDEVFGIKENLTWKGLLGLLDKKIIDVTLVGLTITPERIQVADFSSHFCESYQVVVIRNPHDRIPSYEASRYFKPFGTNVWLTVVVTWLLASCAVGFTFGFSLNVDLRQSNHPVLKSIRNQLFSLWLLLSVMLQRPDFTNLPRNRALPSILIGFFIFAVIIHAIYSSLLTASLTVKKNDILFNDLDDVLDDGRYGISFMPYDTSYEEIKKAVNGTLQRVWKKISSDKGSLVRSVSEGFHKAYHKKYVFMIGRRAGEYEVSRNCNFEMLKEYYLKTSAHVAFQKHSPLKEIFNMKLLDVRSSGVLQKLQQRYFYVNEQRICRTKDVRSKSSVKIHQAIGPFLILVLGVVLASIALFVEVAIDKHLTIRHGTFNENRCMPKFSSDCKPDCSEEKVAQICNINENQEVLQTTKQTAVDEEEIALNRSIMEEIQCIVDELVDKATEGQEARFCIYNENQEVLQTTQQIGSNVEAIKLSRNSNITEDIQCILDELFEKVTECNK